MEEVSKGHQAQASPHLISSHLILKARWGSAGVKKQRGAWVQPSFLKAAQVALTRQEGNQEMLAFKKAWFSVGLGSLKFKSKLKKKKKRKKKSSRPKYRAHDFLKRTAPVKDKCPYIFHLEQTLVTGTALAKVESHTVFSSFALLPGTCRHPLPSPVTTDVCLSVVNFIFFAS